MEMSSKFETIKHGKPKYINIVILVKKNHKMEPD